ncbi:MAG: hypothetical protein ACE5KT_07355 [Methanosarcinales archaeon]
MKVKIIRVHIPLYKVLSDNVCIVLSRITKYFSLSIPPFLNKVKIFLLIILILISLGCESEKKEVSKTLEENITRIVKNTLKNNINQDVQKVREISMEDNFLTYEQGDIMITIKLNADRNINDKNLLEKRILQECGSVLKALYNSKENIGSVTLFEYIPLTDEEGNIKDQIIVRMVLDKPKSTNIDWNNISYEDLPDKVDYYHVNPFIFAKTN